VQLPVQQSPSILQAPASWMQPHVPSPLHNASQQSLPKRQVTPPSSQPGAQPPSTHELLQQSPGAVQDVLRAPQAQRPTAVLQRPLQQVVLAVQVEPTPVQSEGAQLPFPQLPLQQSEASVQVNVGWAQPPSVLPPVPPVLVPPLVPLPPLDPAVSPAVVTLLPVVCPPLAGVPLLEDTGVFGEQAQSSIVAATARLVPNMKREEARLITIAPIYRSNLQWLEVISQFAPGPLRPGHRLENARSMPFEESRMAPETFEAGCFISQLLPIDPAKAA
jgi:hypothetical protein